MVPDRGAPVPVRDIVAADGWIMAHRAGRGSSEARSTLPGGQLLTDDEASRGYGSFVTVG
jgi:hypothetical protein